MEELMRNFQAGQRWTYKTRAGEESSQVFVLDRDDLPNFGLVVHIAVINLRIVNPSSATGFVKWLGHLPVSQVALDESVDELAGEGPIPAEFDASTITEWRSAFERGEGAGIWTTSVSAIVQAIEDGLKSIAVEKNRQTRSQPDDAEAFNNSGLAKRQQGDLDGAAHDFTIAINLRPDVPASFYNRGLVRHAQHDLEGAITDFDRALQLDPDEPDALFNRGHARFDNGDFDGAVADFDQVIRLCPTADAFNNRAVARRYKGDLAGALMDFEEAVRLDPGNGDYIKRRDRAQRELIDCRRTIAADPRKAPLANMPQAAEVSCLDKILRFFRQSTS
jgi:tetratricopeptide (TPR) repeat protein